MVAAVLPNIDAVENEPEARSFHSAVMTPEQYAARIAGLKAAGYHVVETETAGRNHTCACCGGASIVSGWWKPTPYLASDNSEIIIDVCIECGSATEEFYDYPGYPPPPTDQPIYAQNPLIFADAEPGELYAAGD